MKRVLVILLLAALALSCLVAAGIAGFYGYRYYSNHGAGAGAAAFPSESNATPSTNDVPPGPEVSSGALEKPSGLPEVYGQTRRSGNAEDLPAPATEDRQPPKETRPSTTAHPSPGATAPSRVPAPPAPAQPPAAESSPRSEPAREAWKPKPGATAPYSQTRRSGTPDAAAPQPPKAPKSPKDGSLGFIFESRVDRGELVFRVDETTVERVPFQASAENRFRFTRQVPVAPGTHRVKVRVNIPGEEPKVREWSVTVAPGGSTVWKATLDRFPKQLEVKNIP